MPRLLTVVAILVAAFSLGGSLAGADDYPNRPIVLVIPLPPGGTNDIMARAVSDKMSAALGQRIVIENRNAGGSGTVGTREVAQAAPDGYTIILGYTSTLATGPNLYKDVGYDPRKDFAPLGLIASAPALLLVYKDLPVHNVGELIALMKSAKEPYQVGDARRRHRQLPRFGPVRAAGRRQGRADHREGLEPADHRYDGRLRQGRLQSDPGVARRARRRLYPRAGGDLRQAFDADAGSADAGGIRLAGFRRDFELRLAGAGRHAASDRRAAEQGIARGAGERAMCESASSMKAASRRPTTPEQHAAVIDREETKWSAVIRAAGIAPQ